MLLFKGLVLAIVMVTASACPTSNLHAFRKPSATDSRSPCPWINSLANHGYLPRDGKNITIPAMLDAVEEVFNVAPEVVQLFAKLSVTCSKQFSTFDLGGTALHGCIEHDASISRSDFNSASGDNLSFNETLYNTLASKNPGEEFYDISVAGQVMKERLENSLATNNKTVNTIKEITFRSTEAALYLTVMGRGDPKSAQASKRFVDTIFREDRLPIAEGWKKAEVKITNELLMPIIAAVKEASQWVETGGQYDGALPFVLG
ncbi:hypothetical protein Moror_13158 [Moniliophthora roreri MCA 2997]|uniref:Heme haloperoxidase family profile domain-containing protein n=1 Tax=Moniliophthora roreri (strain MCA 2997) TaxID=1381753 RepID=V2YBC5_MONRO|nr:hypothetical protein Moror_13158 [Moniliophthora roreri MCA 2997]